MLVCNPLDIAHICKFIYSDAILSCNTSLQCRLCQTGRASQLITVCIATLTTDTSDTTYTTAPSGRSKRAKSATQNKAASLGKQCHPGGSDGAVPAANRGENSIKRFMVFIDKRMVNNRTSYSCKWPNCAYGTHRSDTIVRHIRSRKCALARALSQLTNRLARFL